MIDSISDVLTRVSGIEQQLQSLQSGTLLDSLDGSGSSAGTSGATSTSSDSTSSTDSSDFAGELAAAQSTSSGDAVAAGTSDPTDSSDAVASTAAAGTTDTGSTSATSSTSTSELLSLLESALGNGTTASSLSSSGGVALSSSASSQLTSSQQQFASTLSADTGLNPNVVSAWLLAEESGGAAQSRQAAGNNDWLNIGYTDSGTYGSSDSVWSDPTTAANATAAWLQGQDSIPGYGTASAGIQSILSSVGQTPAAQIQAIQQSGWSSGGYPSLGSLYEQLAA